MAEQLRVMISSTARDLPEHRKEVMDACLRQGMFPIMMEHLPASNDEAIAASLKMVDEADIYLLILAHRYGYVPKANNPPQISVTEHEYNRAINHNLPILTFIMHEDYLVKAADVEKGEGAVKLGTFKDRAILKVTNFFNSPADLRAHVINSLSHHRKADLTSFHYVSDIPTPPEAFIAHPYTLLQPHRLVGRQAELNLLTNWVGNPDSEVCEARIFTIVAIGGLGKSALTWKWFNDIAVSAMKPLAGRMWWTFYESDASFENFVTRALAYVKQLKLEEVQNIPPLEREMQLLAVLERQPFLLVLDGLERTLIAYARMDAAHLTDHAWGGQTSNDVAKSQGSRYDAARSIIGEHQLRKTADTRVGAFLRKLSSVRAARILISSRLDPADLQTTTGQSLAGCHSELLSGLNNDDAMELWKGFGVSGDRVSLLPLFKRVDNHPLLIQALASEVARYRKAPGDFEQWRQDHLDFYPFSSPLMQVKSHLLEFALRGLDSKARATLQVIAAFRMPARYDTLAALLIGEGKACTDEHQLDRVLTEAEDRGLVGWDKRANRYDLHPIVRGVIWSGLAEDTRRHVYHRLHVHFEALPMIEDHLGVTSLEDLTPAIELCNTLIGLGRYDDAGRIFYERLSKAMLYRLAIGRQRVELLEMFFPDGVDQLPRMSDRAGQAYILSSLGIGYRLVGQPQRSVLFFRRNIAIRSDMKNHASVSTGLRNLSDALLVSGSLCESEAAALRGLVISRAHDNTSKEANSLYWVGLATAARSAESESESALHRALRIRIGEANSQGEGVVNSFLAQRALWLGQFGIALSFARRALELAHIRDYKGDVIRAARQQGEARLGLNDLVAADEQLNYSLTGAVNIVDEELSTRVALAELRRRQIDPKRARELLDDVWEAAERGPYPLIQADAFNVLAQIERDEGNNRGAIEAATKAYQLAWCDGPPFAYHWGLEKAKRHLKELGALEPEMPPFDESKFEPMPEVQIDPEDEFHVGAGTADEPAP